MVIVRYIKAFLPTINSEDTKNLKRTNHIKDLPAWAYESLKLISINNSNYRGNV